MDSHLLLQVQADNSSVKPKKIQKPIFTIFVSLIILSIVVVGAMIGALIIHESKTKFQTLLTDPAELIRFVCGLTSNQPLCIQGMSDMIKGPLQPDPELLFTLSLRATLSLLVNLTSVPKTLIPNTNDRGTELALERCSIFFEGALSPLNRSVVYMESDAEENALTQETIDKLRLWISAATANQLRCWNRLQETRSTVVDELSAEVLKSREYIRNSLDILGSIDIIRDRFYPPVDRVDDFTLYGYIFCLEFVVLVFAFCLLLRIS